MNSSIGRYAIITVLFIGLLSASLLVPARAQEQKPNERVEPALRIETELVQIDVVVANKQGKLVRDLRREDFELYEDGRRQQLTHFAIGTSAKPARWLSAEKPAPNTPKREAATEVNAGRYIVLAADDFHLEPGNLVAAKRTLQKFVNQQMVPGDQVALVATSGNIGLLQQFTNERAVLERAISRLTVQNRTALGGAYGVPRISDYQAELIDLGDPDAIELAVQEILRNSPEPGPPSRGSRGNPAAEEGSNSPRGRAISQARTKARQIVAENAHYTQATLSTIESTIRSLTALPGRKVLVMLSDGFFLGGSSASRYYDLRRIIDAATRAGVVIYTIDARGLVAIPPGGDASSPSQVDITNPGARFRVDNGAITAKQDGLFALAHDTGGQAFFNNNDLSAGLQRVLDDNETYYVLAYEPPLSRRDGKFHQIEVRIADRPELKVRTRKGYFAPSEKPVAKAEAQPNLKPKDAEKAAEIARDKQLRAGLGSLFPLREIPVALAAEFINLPDKGSCIIVNAQIETATLNFERTTNSDRQHAGVDLALVLFDERGKVANSLSEHLDINLSQAALAKPGTRDFNYRQVFPVKPGFYQARIALRESASTRLGSATYWAEVPDLSKKTLAAQ